MQDRLHQRPQRHHETEDSFVDPVPPTYTQAWNSSFVRNSLCSFSGNFEHRKYRVLQGVLSPPSGGIMTVWAVMCRVQFDSEAKQQKGAAHMCPHERHATKHAY